MKTWARVTFVLAALFVSALESLTIATVAQAASEPKVRICHFPPGNPGNVQVITIGASAVASHVANHNDAVCTGGSASCCYGGSAPSACTSFASDPNNCGSCGHVCGAGSTCNAGQCVSVCGAGTTFCGCACTNTGTDNDNCGACGRVCGAGTACAGGACVGVCGPGTTFCGSQCLNTQTDNNNCGSCGNVCPAKTTCTGGACIPICESGQTLCGTTCVDTGSDNNNCGACGHVCSSPDTCIASTCTPPAVAESCLPSSSLSVLIRGPKVTAYVPVGSWDPLSGTGVRVVPLEPVGASSTVATTRPVNSCSSNNVTGTTVCTGNINDVYVINGSVLSSTATAGATGSQSFSGGNCQTCGVAYDALTGKAWIAEGAEAGGGQLQSFDPTGPTFGSPIGLFGKQTSENISVDPVRKLVLSAVEDEVFTGGAAQFQIVNTTTGAVYNSAITFADKDGKGFLDSTAEDCKTGVALAPIEFSQSVVLVNLSGLTSVASTPGLWAAPTNVQDFSPDFANLVSAGNSGSAVAPGSHLAVIADEFGGAGIGVLQLPSSILPAAIPAAVDWVSANVQDDPSTAPWSMGEDPHTVTAYVSPNDHKAYALISNAKRTFLVKVDMAMLLAAPRIAGTHTADPLTIPAGTFTFVAQ